MANEITLTASLAYADGNTSDSLAVTSLSVDVTGSSILHHRQVVGTSEEVLLLGDAGAGGYCILINRDSTNFIEVRPNTAVADLIKIGPGEAAMFRLAADAVPYVIADTADCDLEYLLIEA